MQSLERSPSEMALGEQVIPVSPVPVVSILLFRDATKAEILLGVRRASAFNQRHPGVLSTPTLRIPEQLFQSLAAEAGGQDLRPGDCKFFAENKTFTIGYGSYFRSMPAFTLEAICARKLGMADSLTKSGFSGSARARSIAVENVNDPQGTQVSELTAMLTYELVIHQGPDLFPYETEAYSRLIWAPAIRLQKALKARDALILNDTLNPFEVCIDGLCIRSAAAVISEDQKVSAADRKVTAAL